MTEAVKALEPTEEEEDVRLHRKLEEVENKRKKGDRNYNLYVPIIIDGEFTYAGKTFGGR